MNFNFIFFNADIKRETEDGFMSSNVGPIITRFNQG